MTVTSNAGNKRKHAPGTLVVVAALGGSLIFGSPALRDFLQTEESGREVVLTVYADKVARGVPTVCDGLTNKVTRTPIIVGQRWTPEKCERETRAALVGVQQQLVKCFRVLPPQSVFDMGSSHAWNNGAPKTCNSAALRAWNAGDYVTGCRRLAFSDGGKPVWAYVWTGRTMANGKREMRFVKSLHKRRHRELAVCRQLASYNPGPAVWQ